MAHDLFNDIQVKLAEPPALNTNSDAAIVSTILDTSGFDSNTFVGVLGTCTDAGFTTVVLMEEGDNSALSDAAAVADADLIGTEAGCQFTQATGDLATFKLGYKGTKRYIRVTITPTGNGAGDIPFAGIWLQGNARSLPKSTQIVT